ncbi:MAG: SAM-dependent methyltransferase [Pseudobdellovibrionaceae bacterium]
MSLTLIATPIGHDQDISLRALETLKNSKTIILEEFKESTRFLRAHGISGKIYEQLNEHSKPEDLKRLTELCVNEDVVLITDCGTPGFCDPGADLVRECRKRGISVVTFPGASSLMGILSLSSQRLDQFVFRGFLPAETEARQNAWQEMQKEKRAFVLMDTPYRFQKMLKEALEFLPQRKLLLTVNLTQETEMIFEGTAAEILKKELPAKAEFMLLVYPSNTKS